MVWSSVTGEGTYVWNHVSNSIVIYRKKRKSGNILFLKCESVKGDLRVTWPRRGSTGYYSMCLSLLNILHNGREPGSE